MRKVGVVSLYYRSLNLGGLLQSYAMTRILDNAGYESRQICYEKVGLDKNGILLERQMKISLLKVVGLKKIVSKTWNLLTRPFEGVVNKRIKMQLEKQRNIFSEFEAFVPHTENIYNAANVDDCNNEFDMFVCGSDQVWNPSLLAHRAYFLDFVNKEKRVVAYAVSAGKSRLTEIEQSVFSKYIKKFEILGVREKSLQTLLENFNKKSEVVLDPTLLLSTDEWQEIANFSVVPKEKYIFCYFLGGTVWQRKMVANFAKQRNIKVIHLPYIMNKYRVCDKYLQGEGRYDVGPREFIALVQGAEYIFTDSFHAMAFSFLFQKQFYIFDRNSERGALSMNARINDFLEMFQLEERHIVTKKDRLDNMQIDYAKIVPIYDEKKKSSINFLCTKLETENEIGIL